jgi:hypothetical protein
VSAAIAIEARRAADRAQHDADVARAHAARALVNAQGR